MNYKFTDFTWLASANGFNYPIDVYHGSIHLGTLEAKAHAFVILTVDTPSGKQSIKQSKVNEFKSKNIAAEVLHKTWKAYRHGGDDEASAVLKEGTAEKFWWLDPNGKLHPVPREGHAPFAKQLVNKMGGSTSDVYGTMYDMGWIRVTFFGFMSQYGVHFNLRKGKRPTTIQRDALLALAKDQGATEIIDDTNGGMYAYPDEI